MPIEKEDMEKFRELADTDYSQLMFDYFHPQCVTCVYRPIQVTWDNIKHGDMTYIGRYNYALSQSPTWQRCPQKSRAALDELQ